MYPECAEGWSEALFCLFFVRCLFLLKKGSGEGGMGRDGMLQVQVQAQAQRGCRCKSK